MLNAELTKQIKEVLAREWSVSVETIPADAALNRHPRWDSLGHISLLLALQKELGLPITAETVQQLTSLPKIASFLAASSSDRNTKVA